MYVKSTLQFYKEFPGADFPASTQPSHGISVLIPVLQTILLRLNKEKEPRTKVMNSVTGLGLHLQATLF